MTTILSMYYHHPKGSGTFVVNRLGDRDVKVTDIQEGRATNTIHLKVEGNKVVSIIEGELHSGSAVHRILEIFLGFEFPDDDPKFEHTLLRHGS